MAETIGFGLTPAQRTAISGGLSKQQLEPQLGMGSLRVRDIPNVPNKHTTTSLSYPLNVEGDSQLGHYIMFFIRVVDKGALAAQKAARKDARQVAIAQAKADVATFAPWHTPSAAHRGAGWRRATKNLAETQTRFDDPNKGGESILLRNRPTKRLDAAISLYMPPNITVNYESKWNDGNVSIQAQTGYEAIKGFMEGGWEGVGATLKGVLEGVGEAVRIGAIGMLDVAAPGAKTLYAIERGKIMTPKMEMMFEGIGRRNFSYTFVFIPKSVTEARAVKNIIHQFKYHMAANFVGGGQNTYREMEIPSMFDIQYMHIGNENRNLNKIGTCALTKVDVEYGGDKYVSHEGGVPQTTKLTLAFTELEIVTKDRIAEGY